MRDPLSAKGWIAAALLASLLGGCGQEPPAAELREALPPEVAASEDPPTQPSPPPPPPPPPSPPPPPPPAYPAATEDGPPSVERPAFEAERLDEPPGEETPSEDPLDASHLELLEIVEEGRAVRALARGQERLLRQGQWLGRCRVLEIGEDSVLFDQYGDEVEKMVERYWPIRFLGEAAYAFNTPPGLRYREPEDVIFRVDPTRTALELKEVVEQEVAGDPLLRGSVEAATGRWSRCMEAELVETTIDSKLRARPAPRPKLTVQPLVVGRGPQGEESWVPAGDGDTLVRRMGQHPTDWRWRVEGIRPGRTQLVLRLYAVAVLKRSRPGSPECGEGLAGGPGGAERVRTLQRRIAVEVAPAEWVDARLPTPWLWSLLLAPAGLALVWWRRRRRRPAPPSSNGR